jgi:hypothetical protein
MTMEKKWILDYRGEGCGGCNLPFSTMAAGLLYADSRGATSATFHKAGPDPAHPWQGATVAVAKFNRRDRRYRWDRTTARASRT